MKMYCVNNVAINLSNNLVLHDKTKHVEVDEYFIRKKVNSKELVLRYVKTHGQVAQMHLPRGCPQVISTKKKWAGRLV